LQYLGYNWHRFYDPTTGRYISADPIGLGGGINLYGYVNGDPVNKVDPKGLFSPCNPTFNGPVPKKLYKQRQSGEKLLAEGLSRDSFCVSL
jgi:hypothetical protein